MGRVPCKTASQGEKKLPPIVLSLQEVQRMITVTNNIKHRAILMLTYSAGLRRMEVLQIKPRDIDSQRMQVRIVQGKGKKDRYTILSWKTLEVLRMYYKLERPSTYLFEPMGGRKGQPLSERTVEYIVKNSAKNAGIKKRGIVSYIASLFCHPFIGSRCKPETDTAVHGSYFIEDHSCLPACSPYQNQRVYFSIG